MTTDLQKAKESLLQNTIVLVKGESFMQSQKRGIAPMLEFLQAGIDLQDYSVADLVVGKAVAMLFVLAKIKEVYAKTISVSAKDFLEAHQIPVFYETLATSIQNRAGTGPCPMERAVLSLSDPSLAYSVLQEKQNEMKRSSS